MNRYAREYSTRGHRQVGGWLSDTAVAIVGEVARIQDDMELTGPVCEIGVHHGRLFILLHLLTRAPERSVAWDLFERQDENVDQSGHGDLAVLTGNLGRHHADMARVRIVTANSLSLTVDDVHRECGNPPRIFSIDGGHTAEVTLHDLTLAAGAIADSGVIVVDDFFNEAWPGVAEGVCRYFSDPPLPLCPALIGGNKFVFTRSPAAARAYREGLNLPHGLYGVKQTTVFGQDVAVVSPYGRTLARRVMHSGAGLALRGSVIGQGLRRLMRRT